MPLRSGASKNVATRVKSAVLAKQHTKFQLKKCPVMIMSVKDGSVITAGLFADY